MIEKIKISNPTDFDQALKNAEASASSTNRPLYLLFSGTDPATGRTRLLIIIYINRIHIEDNIIPY